MVRDHWPLAGKKPELNELVKEAVAARHLAPAWPAQTTHRIPGKDRQGTGGRRSRRSLGRRLILFATMAVLVFLASGAVLWFTQDNSWRFNSQHVAGLRAVLVDELSATVPDPSFVNTATAALKSGGFSVDYYGPADVTVSFFRDLPLKGYGLVIIRAHSGASLVYTSEPYSTSKYVLEQLTDEVASVLVNNQVYFAITPKFVREVMRGNFPGSLILDMGCSGLAGTDLAQSFLDRGATAFVGWDRAVSPNYTDASTGALVEGLVQGKSLREAVTLTTNQMGRDSLYQSRLAYYDSTIGPKQKATESLMGLASVLAVIILAVAAIGAIILLPKLFGKL